MEGYKEFLKVGIWLTLLAEMVIMLGGCSRVEYVPVETIKTDTLFIKTERVDSVYKHDSIMVQAIGDTVYFDRWHTLYKVKESVDTIYKAKTDSVPVPYRVTETKEVEKPLSWWQKTEIYGFRVAVLLLLLWILWKNRKKVADFLSGLVKRL
jgi:hypothetical protein